MAKSEIRQAKSEVTLVGILKEKDVKIETTKREGADVKAIKGQIVIATDDVAEHRVTIFAYEKTAKGEDNKSFISAKALMEQFVSIADRLEQGDTIAEATTNADVVEVKGCQLEINEYYSQAGMLVSNPKIKGSFFHRAKDKSKENFKANFDIEVFFTGHKPEVVKGDETGRTIVSAILPMYDGKVAPIQFVCSGGVADYIDSNYEKNKSGRIWGQIVNRVIRNKKIIEGFGEAKEETNVEYVNELLITGGEPQQYDEDDTKAWKKSDITDAMAERELRLEKAKAENEGKGKGNTASGNKSGMPSF